MINEDSKLALDEKTRAIIDESLQKFGKISEAFLMRKLKCSYSRAQVIINSIRSDNGTSVALEKF